jgi:hypothetical protein
MQQIGGRNAVDSYIPAPLEDSNRLGVNIRQFEPVRV